MKKINFWKMAGVGLILIALVIGVSQASALNGIISSNLAVGSRGEDVSTLQSFLAGSSNIYPSGLITGYFGTLTQAAVRQFQVAYGITGEDGRVGLMTMAKFNTLSLSGLGVDIASPVIYGLGIQLSNNSATFSWNTNELARSKIFYDTRPLIAYETTQNFAEPIITGSVNVDSNFALSHNMTVNGLMSQTTYYYIIETIDRSGNPSVTVQGSFRTN